MKKKDLCKELNLFFASGFYSGFLPKSPGTYGTLTAMVFYFVIISIFNFDIANDNLLVASLAIISVIAGTIISNKILTYEEYKDTKDPQFIVIDEWAGFFITILLSQSVGEVLVGFIIFRILDITKPWVIKKAENLPRGYGIMADDIVAGIFGFIIMNLIFIRQILNF